LHCRQQLYLRLRVAVDKRWETHVNDTAPEVFIAEHPAMLLYASRNGSPEGKKGKKG
jgi:hypothetical protein